MHSEDPCWNGFLTQSETGSLKTFRNIPLFPPESMIRADRDRQTCILPNPNAGRDHTHGVKVTSVRTHEIMLSGRSENDWIQGANAQETFQVFKILQRRRPPFSERCEGHESGGKEPRQSLCAMQRSTAVKSDTIEQPKVDRSKVCEDHAFMKRMILGHGSSRFSTLFFAGLMPESVIL